MAAIVAAAPVVVPEDEAVAVVVFVAKTVFVDADVVVFAVVDVVGAVGAVDAEEFAIDAVAAAFKGAEILEKKSSCRPKTTSEVDDDDAL